MREKVYNVSKHYLNNLEYEYDKIEITGMWANKLYQGDAHPPHTHSNNILSGVYYLKSDNNLSNVLANSPSMRKEFERDFKLRHDPRITSIGRFSLL